MPFRLSVLTGRPRYCEQDSAEDVGSCVVNLVACPQGANPYDAAFGVPLVLFNTLPVDTSGIVSAVSAQETRLQELTATEARDTVTGALDIALTGYADS